MFKAVLCVVNDYVLQYGICFQAVYSTHVFLSSPWLYQLLSERSPEKSWLLERNGRVETVFVGWTCVGTTLVLAI